MTRSRPITLLASSAAVALLALSAVACGGGASAAAPAPTSKPTSASTQIPTVRVANTSLGSILVDSKGRTLYLFKADTGTKSTCTGACAAAWPPLRTAGNPTVASGADATLVGITRRSNGAAQVTYNGHPLYLYVGDKKPGDVNGQGAVAFGAPWYVVAATGHQVSSQSTGSPVAASGGY